MYLAKVLKKMKGHNYAFRIRIKNYRIGFFYQNEILSKVMYWMKR